MPSNLSEKDLQDLRDAVLRLERISLAMRIADKVGRPIEYGLKRLPAGGREVIQRAAHLAIEKCLEVALRSLRGHRTAASGPFHKIAAGVSGAVGGFYGFTALALELPVSTTLMLRSIAETARDQGENLDDPHAKLACLEVFALGSPSSMDDAAETGYFAIRAALAKALQEAAVFVGQRGITERGAPALVRFVAQIASRFGVTVSEKAAAQSVPVIGALTGSTINVVFTDHFQQVAQGHFTVRRLERRYGADLVRSEYERLKAGLGAS